MLWPWKAKIIKLKSFYASLPLDLVLGGPEAE